MYRSIAKYYGYKELPCLNCTTTDNIMQLYTQDEFHLPSRLIPQNRLVVQQNLSTVFMFTYMYIKVYNLFDYVYILKLQQNKIYKFS